MSDGFPDWAWVARNTGLITGLLAEHVLLTFLSVAIGFAIAAPLAVAATRRRRLYAPILGVTNVLFTVPSLALFVLLIGVAGTGIGRTTAVTGLVLYSLLILFRNTAAGLDAVPAAVVESATAMGYRPLRRLLVIDVPLALPVIISGIRLAIVTAIGLVTVTALVGQGGLGRLIYQQGFVRQNRTALLLGFVLSIALAVAADVALAAIERWATPWARARSARGGRGGMSTRARSARGGRGGMSARARSARGGR